MAASKVTVTVHPVPWHFVNGIAPVVTVTDAATAKALVATGAFSFEPPKSQESKP